MARAEEALREIGIFNPHGALTFARKRMPNYQTKMFVAIDYSAGVSSGLAAMSGAWVVFSPYFQTDPGRHGGFRKSDQALFGPVNRDNKAAKLEEAKQWAGERFGIAKWERIPGLGSAWFPSDVVDTVREALREARHADSGKETRNN